MMRITKRDQTQQEVDVGKIKKRLERLRKGTVITKSRLICGTDGSCSADKKENYSNAPSKAVKQIIVHELPELLIDIGDVVTKVCGGLCDGIKSQEIDNLSADVCASLCTVHPNFGILAARIVMSNLHKETLHNFSDKIELLYKKEGIINKQIYDIVMKNKNRINSAIDYKKDYLYNYFGIKTLMNAYILRSGKDIVERPQDMLMRVALGIHFYDIDSAIETYNCMANRYFTHATPTLFNAGTIRPQLSSCFLLDMQSDSIDGIFNTIHRCALISKNSGGIGVHIHKIRAKGSKILGTNGTSNGIVPMLKVFDSTAKYVDQGGNKRPGSIAVYLEPWHADIFEFLELRKNTGKDEVRARDLFLGLWIPDLFMERVEKDLDWSLFCPNEAFQLIPCDNESDKENMSNELAAKGNLTYKRIGLADVYGEEFKKMYETFENNGLARKTFKAQLLWKAIIEAQIETGNPYMLYKDSCNIKNNQKNLGTLKGSNLCTEILEYTAPDEIAVCNLASIGLPAFIKTLDDDTQHDDLGLSMEDIYITENGRFYFDYAGLRHISGMVANNLNKIIDVNFYPLHEAEYSNFKHRPIGMGVQGLADCFAILRLPFESEKARILNKKIFENLYYGALHKSNELAKEEGPYDSYEGSPIHHGKLQFDMWPDTQTGLDWSSLREDIKLYGVRNSLLIAPMPTASTSQILGFNECIEPFTSNIYSRRTLAGEFQMVNTYLLNDLIKLGLWTPELKNILIEHEGSIQQIAGIPDEIKEIYKTAWEMKMRNILDLAADRSPFIDQSQSLNLFVAEPTYSKLTSMHFYGWKKGLKTGMYYLRTKPIGSAIKFTVDKEMVNAMNDELQEGAICRMEDGCLNCSG